MDPSDRAVCIRIAQREALAPQCKGGSALDRQGSAAARAGRSEPGVRGHLPWVRPASAAIGPELRVRPAAASSWPGKVSPRGACPTVLRDRPLAPRRVEGRAASLLTAPRDDRRGQILPTRAAAGPIRAFRPGGAIFEIAGARALGWRPRASRPAWRGRRLRERASAAPPRGRGCRRAGQRRRAGEHSFLRGEKASPHSHALLRHL